MMFKRTEKSDGFLLDMVCALAVRLCFLLYGEWQDRSALRVKYTDVDYRVFTDAARYVAEGSSPYFRATYRYTPAVAWLCVANVLVHPVCGKLIFIFSDLLSAWFIHKTASQRRATATRRSVARWLWLFNPFTVTMSTRGSAESIVSALVLGTVHFLEDDRIVTSGIVYGLAIHFKIYPIIYCLPLYFTLAEDVPTKHDIVGKMLWFLRPTYKRTKFTLATVLSFLLTSGLCYYLYGDRFLHETYLYHITRKDTRHNFSVYFYQLYLNASGGSSSLTELLTFLPQAILLVAVAVRFHRRERLHVGLFLQTLVFVAFNKVCTSQYFVWYLTLLPLAVLHTPPSFRKRHLAWLLAWLASQALWLLPAYLLEFQNVNAFLWIWLASLVFFCCNLYVAADLIKTM